MFLPSYWTNLLTILHALRATYYCAYNMLKILVIFLFLTAGALPCHAATSPWSDDKEAPVRLVAGGFAEKDGKTVLHAGVEYRLQEGWHSYWRTPGDVGMTSQLDWQGSTNLRDASIRWPVPERRIDPTGLQDFIHSGNFITPVDIIVEDATKPTDLTLSIRYLVCKELCLPKEAKLALHVPPYHQDNAVIGALAAQKMPAANGEHGLKLLAYQLQHTKDGAVLTVKAASDTNWNVPDLIVEGAPNARFLKPMVTFDNDNIATFTIPIELSGKKVKLTGSMLHFTLINDNKHAVEQGVSADIRAEFIPLFLLNTILEKPTAPTAPPASLLLILAIALAGGLILNGMPCVLPVLSIKLLSIIKHGGADRKQIRTNFLASSLGIIISFLVIALGLILLKNLGHSVGFGFQFQEPVFLIALVVILILFACNLWGSFEINLPYWVGGFAIRKIQNADNTVVAHFLSGAFATILATPCSAPLVGTAISFAFSHGAGEIIAIFTMMGIGMAIPYLLLSLFPQLVAKLPKPGRWMEKVKYALALALVITALWLIWVISQQLGLSAALILLLLCLLLKFTVERRSSHKVKQIATALIIILAFVLPLKTYEKEQITEEIAKDIWQVFDENKIEPLVASGKIVLVDVTADWCLSCKINKLTLFDRADVLKYLKQKDVVAMRADLTSPNPKIIDYLKKFNRYGIPFNVVYGPGAPKGLPLSELPRKKELVTAIENAGRK